MIDAELGEAQRDFGAAQEAVARGESSLRDLGVAMAEYATRRRGVAQRQRTYDLERAAASQAFPQHWHDARQQAYDDAMAESDKLAADAATLSAGRVPSGLPLPRDLLKQAQQIRARGDEMVRKARKFLDAAKVPQAS